MNPKPNSLNFSESYSVVSAIAGYSRQWPRTLPRSPHFIANSGRWGGGETNGDCVSAAPIFREDGAAIRLSRPLSQLSLTAAA